MGSFTDHESGSLVKMLVAADSGAGKTGAICSLIDAGFRIRVLDYDNGLSPFKHYVKDKTKLANVEYATLVDEYSLAGGRMGIKGATAWQKTMNMLDKGGTGAGTDECWSEAVPPLRQWTSRDILVVDSFGKMGKAALNLVLFVNGAMNKAPEIQHYGTAMDNLEKWLGQVTSNRTPCHLIINTHLTKDEGSPKQYPLSLGSKMNPKVATEFDNFFSISMTGANRTIKTKKDGLLALKCAKPLTAEYNIEDGYAKIFKELTGVAKLSDLWELPINAAA